MAPNRSSLLFIPAGGLPLYNMEVRDPGGGGALTLVLGTHCKTDSWSCGCRLEKKGGGAVRGAFPIGAVIVSLASPRKASWISYT